MDENFCPADPCAQRFDVKIVIQRNNTKRIKNILPISCRTSSINAWKAVKAAFTVRTWLKSATGRTKILILSKPFVRSNREEETAKQKQKLDQPCMINKLLPSSLSGGLELQERDTLVLIELTSKIEEFFKQIHLYLRWFSASVVCPWLEMWKWRQ